MAVVRPVPGKLAVVRLAADKLAQVSLAPDNFAQVRLAPDKLALVRQQEGIRVVHPTREVSYFQLYLSPFSSLPFLKKLLRLVSPFKKKLFLLQILRFYFENPFIRRVALRGLVCCEIFFWHVTFTLRVAHLSYYIVNVDLTLGAYSLYVQKSYKRNYVKTN